ncbi:MBL fold metallo-hydrolase [Dechloromonas denitrificans]|uniref:MBL fold metallo-hydrolase n=1 Tax=Dechloromonas denitrificans TaxID=281362 RepID=A0A133XJU6_9RHOO|nr:MBL fold metallo-hydrolase [Dechloromonas denitrificans]KXB31197.1 MBL fold metallo-hydrolase [Dechloromonas denitrificans]
MNRRRFLQASAAFSALSAVEFAPWQSLNAFAKEVDEFIRGPAVKDHPLRQVSKHVWMIFSPDGFPTPENQGMMCNITFVNTAKGLVVVDSGASVQIGEMAIRQVRKAFKKPVIAIINTHYHGDHWLGNHAFVEAYGDSLPRYSHPGTIKAVQGVQGNMWRTLMEQWTNQATLGTRVVPPNLALENGAELKFGDVTLRVHHFGTVHTPFDLCVEVLEDKLMLVGDVAMDRRIANMDDGSYLGTLQAYNRLEKTASTIWLPGHGEPGANVLKWNRELFEGIYRPCEQAIKDGLGLEEAKALVLKDPRVASRAKETKGFESNIGKYVSLAYLEAEAAGF